MPLRIGRVRTVASPQADGDGGSCGAWLLRRGWTGGRCWAGTSGPPSGWGYVGGAPGERPQSPSCSRDSNDVGQIRQLAEARPEYLSVDSTLRRVMKGAEAEDNAAEYLKRSILLYLYEHAEAASSTEEG